MHPKKKTGFFLKVVVVVLAVYAAVTLVRLQIELNTQGSRNMALTQQRDEQLLKNAALSSFSESDMDDETIAQIARQDLGLVKPDEILIVDVG